MTQSLTRGFLVLALLVSFAAPSVADAAVGSITIGDINGNGGAVLGASTQTLTDLQINAVLGLLQAFGADQSTINNVRNALKGTTSPGTDTGSTPITTTPSSNSNEPPSDEGSSSAASSASSSSNEPVVITSTGYHEGKFYVKTALSGTGQKYRYLEKGISVVLGGQTYQTTSGTRVGNVYIPNSLASQLLVGTLVTVLKADIVVTGTGTSEGGKFLVKTSQSGPGGEYREIPLGELFTIGGVQYRTIAGSGVGNIYLPDSARSQVALGAVVVRGVVAAGSSPQGNSETPSATSPSCTLSASPSSVVENGSVTLEWSALNATSFSINQNVGVVSPASSGSKSVVVPSTRTYTGTATGSGGTAYCGTTVTTSTATVPTVGVSPAVGIMSLPSTGLEDGRLIRFKVTADSRGSVGLGEFGFSIVSSGVSLSSIRLFGYEDSAYSSPISGQGSAGQIDISLPSASTLAFLPAASGVQIPTGQTRYFELRATVTGASTGSSVVTTLLGSSSFQHLTSRPLVVGHFIWSPNSTTTSSFSHNDWKNGFGVPGLPAGGISQTRTGASTTTYACSDGIDNDGDSFKDAEDPGCSGASDNDEFNAPTATAAAPSCTLSASPSSVTAGGSVTLQWGALNATSFSINQNVGIVSPASSGSKSVVVPSTRTYTGTATGSGGTAYCGTTVTTSAPQSTTSSQPTVTSTGYYNGIFYAKTTASQSGEAYRTTQKGETFVIGGKAYQTVGGSNVGSIYLPTSADGVIQVGDTVVRPTAP